MFVAIKHEAAPDWGVKAVFGPFTNEDKGETWVIDYITHVEGLGLRGEVAGRHDLYLLGWTIQEVSFVDEDQSVEEAMAEGDLIGLQPDGSIIDEFGVDRSDGQPLEPTEEQIHAQDLHDQEKALGEGVEADGHDNPWPPAIDN